MLRLHRETHLAHPRWLIYPAFFCFSIDSTMVALSQESTPVTIATAEPDTSYRPQPAREEPQPTPEGLGDILRFHQRYQAAIASYSKATPTSDIWDKMGISYQMMFSTSGAMRCYKESLKLNPENAHALNNLGSLHFSLREFAEAERMYRKALALETRSAPIQMNLGTALIAEHRFEEGWEHYRAALDIDPHAFENTTNPRISSPGLSRDRGAVNYYLARGFARAGLMDTAIDHLRKALDQGFANRKRIEADNSFASLRDNPEYQNLLSEPHRP
jgi:tetratricopeptide (TPR) repeat protein